MSAWLKGAITGFALLAACASAAAQSPEVVRVSAQLPREFSGSFKWRGEEPALEVEFLFAERSSLEGSKLEVKGGGTYHLPGQVTHIRVRAVIDAASLDIEIWELAPTTTVFVTEGTHRGKLSPDLRSISAVWVNEPTKKTGDLTLAASRRQR
jgi:hypothetical protein